MRGGGLRSLTAPCLFFSQLVIRIVQVEMMRRADHQWPTHMWTHFGERPPAKTSHGCCRRDNRVYCLCPEVKEAGPLLAPEPRPGQAHSISPQPLVAVFSQDEITEGGTRRRRERRDGV